MGSDLESCGAFSLTEGRAYFFTIKNLRVESFSELNGGIVKDEALFFDAYHMTCPVSLENAAYILRVTGSDKH